MKTMKAVLFLILLSSAAAGEGALSSAAARGFIE